jgi:hypothetical protein
MRFQVWITALSLLVVMSVGTAYASDPEGCSAALTYIEKLSAIYGYAQGADRQRRITDLKLEYYAAKKALRENNRRLWELIMQYEVQRDICDISGHLDGYAGCHKAKAALEHAEELCR